MTVTMIVGFVALVALISIWSWMSAKKWTTLLVANGKETDDALRKYEYLKSSGVRCKLKTEAAVTPGGPALGYTGMATGDAGVARLMVDCHQLDEAKELLDNFQ